MPMLINLVHKKTVAFFHRGVSLIELIVFMLVVSIALLSLMCVYQQATGKNVDPLMRVRALEAAQSKLDEILALKYDANTPTGGIPACSSTDANAVACNNASDADRNDVDDFNGFSDEPYTGYNRQVTVTNDNNIKIISVTVIMPTGGDLTLAAERANF